MAGRQKLPRAGTGSAGQGPASPPPASRRRARTEGDRAGRAARVASHTRLGVGDLVRFIPVPWCARESEAPAVRCWDLGGVDYVWAPVGEVALLVAVDRPVSEFRAPGTDTHWVVVLHAGRRLEALSDELERVPE